MTQSRTEAAKQLAKRKPVNLRKSRRTTLTGLNPDDRVVAQFDAINHEFRLLVETNNGVQILHERLTPLPPPS